MISIRTNISSVVFQCHENKPTARRVRRGGGIKLPPPWRVRDIKRRK